MNHHFFVVDFVSPHFGILLRRTYMDIKDGDLDSLVFNGENAENKTWYTTYVNSFKKDIRVLITIKYIKIWTSTKIKFQN